MSKATIEYADWCEGQANFYVKDADLLSDLGDIAGTKHAIDYANQLYAEARAIRSGSLILAEDATRNFLRGSIN